MSSALSTDIQLGDAWRTLTRLLGRLREVSHREDWLIECLDALVQQLDADRCLVLTHSAGTDFVVEARSAEGGLDAAQRQRISHTLLRRCRSERQMVRWELGDDAHATESLAAFGIVAAVAIPLSAVGGDAVVGALYIDFRRPQWTLDGTAIALLESVADAVSIVLDRQRAVQTARSDLLDARSDEAGLTLAEILGAPGMGAVQKEVAALGERTPLLIAGEIGSGKSVLAMALARASTRRPIVRALPLAFRAPGELSRELFGAVANVDKEEATRVGLVERADGGTLILESVHDYGPDVRERLADFARFGTYRPDGWRGDSRRSEARIIATAEDAGAINASRLRPLAERTLVLPSLRHRRDEIVPFARSMLARLDPARSWSIAEDARQWLSDPAKGWPGNLAQLLSLVRKGLQRALAEDALSTLRARHLSSADRQPEFVSDSYDQLRARKAELEEDERRFLAAKMEAHGYNLSRVAREVGLARTSLISRLDSLGIDRPAGKPGRPR
ncbi:MAG: sigma 54-interacting transcriptional regulator [Myxococcota bacterium]